MTCRRLRIALLVLVLPLIAGACAAPVGAVRVDPHRQPGDGWPLRLPHGGEGYPAIFNVGAVTYCDGTRGVRVRWPEPTHARATPP
jgi:hypothetical protein